MSETTIAQTFTPGPWSVVRRRAGFEPESWIAYIKADTHHTEVAVLYSDERQEANAALIAAAPSLLTALTGLLEVLPSNWAKVIPSEVNDALDAVATAEGRSR